MDSCPWGQSTSPRTHPSSLVDPSGVSGESAKPAPCQDGAQVTWAAQVPHLLSVQHSSPVELSTALLLPHIVAKSEQTHSSAAQAHLWEGWYVESSPAGPGTLRGARPEQTGLFHRAGLELLPRAHGAAPRPRAAQPALLSLSSILLVQHSNNDTPWYCQASIPICYIGIIYVVHVKQRYSQ